MKIVVTDGFTLNPGDLDWKIIEVLGDVDIHERTPATLVYERCKSADVILTNKTVITGEVIRQLDALKMIAVTATGYNVVDVEAAKSKNIPVCNVPAYGTASVAQHSFALILTLSNHVDVHALSVKQGEWQRSADWSYSKTPLIELEGKTLGIVGMGNIGERTARIAKTFGMRVMYNNRHQKLTDAGQYVSMTELFRESDFISLHCPLTADNQEFVNKDLLNVMKPTSFLINTARGALINESDLAAALNNNQLAGAALDVLSKEPPDDTNPLLKAKNCVITPHNAWMTREARQRIMAVTAENVRKFIERNPQNVVN